MIVKDFISNFSECRFAGDENHQLEFFKSLTDLTEEDESKTISWLKDANLHLLNQKMNPGLLILSQNAFDQLKDRKINFLISPNPRFTFLKMLALLFEKKRESKIENTSVIDSSATIGKNNYVGHHVVIEKNVTIGDDCVIDHNTVIKEGVMIGNRVHIGCNCTIGNSGFGYEKDEEGIYRQIPHIGNVVIEDDVHIHDNTCIDRAMIGSTLIGEQVKIDNLVHVAHGVVIEKNSLIIANSVLAGSVRVGENCWVAPSTTIRNRIQIADNTFTGIGSVIVKNTKPNSLVVGNPAIDFEDFKKWLKLRDQQLSDFREDEIRDK